MSLKKSIILHTCTELTLPVINDINSNIYVISGYELCSFWLLHNKSKRKKEKKRVTSRLWTLQVFCLISIINPLYRQKKPRAVVL